MEAALGLMREEGYDASMLHGIPGYYHRFGYAPCMPEYELRIDTVDAERAAGPLALREPRPADLPALARLYNGENARRTGTALRDADTWKGFPRSVGWFTRPKVLVAGDAKDRVAGYVVYDEASGRIRVAEAGGQGGEVMGSILRFLAQRSVELRKEEIHLVLPPDHPLALYARKFGCRAEIRYPRNGEFLGRIVRLEPFLERIALRLGRDADYPPPSGEVGLSTELGAAVLGFRAGKGYVDGNLDDKEGAVHLGQSALFQMAMGYRTARDLLMGGDLTGPPEKVDLLCAWFPLRNATLYWPDRF
jgi:predicted acetyltransferase